MHETFDFVVIGSGFGGSVSAMRLAQKGYRVLVLERGRRFQDQDFPKTNWIFWKYLWAPALRCFGILQISPFRDVFVLQGCGVGGGSLGYANVLMKPEEALFATPTWRHLADWKKVLEPHYETARRMLGVTTNPRLWPADHVLREIASDVGMGHTFQRTEVGVFFGDGSADGRAVADPYFGGLGPPRNTCTHCGSCMVGCRTNAKNTLVKNYLYFAEKWGAVVQAESQVTDIRPLPPDEPDGARYEVVYHKSTAWFYKPQKRVRSRNVVLSAGTLGSLKLLFRCREVTRSLPRLSPRLGDLVRTNSETLLGASDHQGKTDYSQGIAITSVIKTDPVTAIEPVRYPAGSDLMRLLAAPLLEPGSSVLVRTFKILWRLISHPVDTFRMYLLPGWARRTVILLAMQTEDNRLKMRLGRSLYTLFRRGLVSSSDEETTFPHTIEAGYRLVHAYSRKTGCRPAGSIMEGLFNVPLTAHILGGCPFGRDDREGVVGLDCQVHNYPGLYVVDGSIVPANPGINPSLTIAALAEYAMSQVEPKQGADVKHSPIQASVELAV